MMATNRKTDPSLVQRMRAKQLTLVLLGLLPFLLAGCAAGPFPRLEAYLGSPDTLEQAEPSSLEAALTPPIEIGVLVINDTSAHNSAPPLSPESVTFLTNRLGQELERRLPVRVVKVLSSEGLTAQFSPAPFLQLAGQQGVPFLLLAIFSSVETETPLMLPLVGGTRGAGSRGRVLGFEDRNYALAELAFLHVETGRLLARASGEEWATLERLNVPIQSNSYPVVRRSLLDPPIFPNQEADAHDVLRAVAGEQALTQAVMRLQEQWGGGRPHS